MKSIRVSENRRFLQDEDGNPFFWLGDTAWELFHRLSLEEAEIYFANRRERKFSVIQAVVLAEFDGLRKPNFYGELPFTDLESLTPNPKYFEHVVKVIDLAACYGLYMGILPTWGDKVTPMWGMGPQIFNEQNIRIYGEYLGELLKDRSNIIWILGGDRPCAGFEEVWTALAEGIHAGFGPDALMTLHPSGGQGSSMWFHEHDWLDLNMWQSGHSQLDAPIWEMIAADWQRAPVKPVLDGEPNYEDHPIDPFSRSWQPEFGRFTDYDVRKQAYRSVFAGGCGVTYGHHTVWQFYDETREPVNHPAFFWREAICRPGAAQMQHLVDLMLSRPYFDRIPAPEMILTPQGSAHSQMVATRDLHGRYAYVYIPEPAQLVRLSLKGMRVPLTYTWFDPRTGKVYPKGLVPVMDTMEIRTPIGGPDWVLILESESGGSAVEPA